MNSCILMATIVRKPELRHTQDARAVTDTIVEFEGAKPEEKSTLLVVGWGNLAEEIFANYSVGDRIIIEGRLSMKTVEQKGHKEKKAELVASRIHRVEGATISSSSSSKTTSDEPVTSSTRQSKKAVAQPTPSESFSDYAEVETTIPRKQPVSAVEEDLDEIPFVRSVDSRIVSVGLLDPYEIVTQCPQVGIIHNPKFI
ncbi:MAG: single-stranded DNA-binding protein [Hydrococcus sp. Prado102]|jgi:single-stranded DNA-binding protein|nr:single-stranded DNA-binding protein [Hydrococcus sp. Prado102]